MVLGFFVRWEVRVFLVVGCSAVAGFSSDHILVLAAGAATEEGFGVGVGANMPCAVPVAGALAPVPDTASLTATRQSVDDGETADLCRSSPTMPVAGVHGCCGCSLLYC